ncbi:MAG: SWIM zinc finger family protein [Microlunatus sp.]|nr:SWIM zinc finger family protein [Microlunatus sp.]MDN5769339.1 SWIM zinc finger family protein [Microlunatus sp.]
MAQRFDRGWYPPTKPRRVDGGLKAKTARGEIGASWWSRRFLDVLESFAMGARLTRGKAYARKGQVISLEIRPGEIQASVQGSRARPYQVMITLPVFSELVWAKAEIALSEQALPTAKLLAGEVPPELEEIFTGAGAPLFPTTAGELSQTCSCPDWGVPCKHLAATFYLLAEAFDDDPFLVLRWRGRDRDELLGRLRALRGDLGSTGTVAVDSTPVVGAAMALGDVTWPEPDVTRFWQPPTPLPIRPPSLTVDPDVIVRQLPVPPAAIGGPTLVETLTASYWRFSGREPASSDAGSNAGSNARSR